jgi:hypothetical protein
VTVTVTVAVEVIMTGFMAVIVAESVIVGLHLYFRVTGWGKERGL